MKDTGLTFFVVSEGYYHERGGLWWTRAPRKIASPTLKMAKAICDWELLVSSARSLKHDNLDESDWCCTSQMLSAATMDWKGHRKNEGEHAIVDLMVSYGHVEPYFSTTSPMCPWDIVSRKPDPQRRNNHFIGVLPEHIRSKTEDWYDSWHQWAVWISAQVMPPLFTEGPRSHDFDIDSILQSHEAVENSLGFVWVDGLGRTIEKHLMHECKQAWIEWQRLPSYAEDPDKKETFSNKEVEEIVEAKRKRLGVSKLRFESAYYRDKAWMEKYDEFKEAGCSQPNVAILKWWNDLTQKERDKLAIQQDFAQKLADGGRESDTRKASLETIRQGVKTARNDLQKGQNGKPD